MAGNNDVQPHNQIMLHESLRPLRLQLSDREMKAIRSPEYTSLKDILPPQRLKRQYLSSCCDDISNENPLLKQAVIGYLQTSKDFGLEEEEEEGSFKKLKKKCFNRNQCRCIRWLNNVLFNHLKAAFSNTRQDQIGDDANAPDEDGEKN